MSGRAGLDWIGADWGTTNLRVWAMDRLGGVLARAESENGMGALDQAGFEPALLSLIGTWLPSARVTPVIACGMVGSRQGWVEAPYVAVPCAPGGAGRLVGPPVRDGRIAVHVVRGLKQDDPADVMRGEETQIAGFLSARPQFDGVLCLPGTHSKWARISAGEVVSFQTFMTGEMFALLAQQSVLRHGIAPEGWDETAFLAAVSEAISRPERLAARLFALRAESLLTGLAPVVARSRLSGLLIGAELAGARPYWLGQRVAIVGAGALSRVYHRALAAQGVEADMLEGRAATLAGLTLACPTLEEAKR
jgi:2-dehydro-3-deoxygalactonokinase